MRLIRIIVPAKGEDWPLGDILLELLKTEDPRESSSFKFMGLKVWLAWQSNFGGNQTAAA